MISGNYLILKEKAIVTGGTRGLGYGMAEGLMEAGCEVVIVGTSDKGLWMWQKDSATAASSATV